MSIKAILTDIEGTTTDIKFVHNVLFPYAREQLETYVNTHQNDEAVLAILDQARKEIGKPDADQQTLIQCFIDWIDQDKKVTALKALQGLIWVEGYEQKAFTGHLYVDAYENLKKWSAMGLSLNIFSSGSVKAQKLLFGYSDFGDLTPLFKGYFDTTTGHKREETAYRLIAEKMQFDATEILFLSDIVEELDAAKAAGMQTILLARDSVATSSTHPVVSSFDQISF